MNYNTLPDTDLSVSQLCFGCWGIIPDMHWGERDQNDSKKALLAAVDSGINFFDTATMYGDGASESLLGDVFSQNNLRDKLVIASKAPPNRMKPDEILAECEASLQRLQTDYLDLYQTHWAHPDIPLTESWGALQQLQQQGKVRHIGVCNAGTGDLTEISSVQKPVTNQLPYNLLWRMIETDILPQCLTEGIGVLVYSPLMHGILADKYQTAADVPDGRARSRHFSSNRKLTRHGESGCEADTYATVDRIRKICSELNREMADVALAWIMQREGIVSVIAGASNPQQSQKNLCAVDSPLSEDAVRELDQATTDLAVALGPNPDMWDAGPNARYR